MSTTLGDNIYDELKDAISEVVTLANDREFELQREIEDLTADKEDLQVKIDELEEQLSTSAELKNE